MVDPEVKAAVEKGAARMTCPRCQNEGFSVEWVLRARPLGSFSLSGSQVKFSAVELPVLTCLGCGLEAEVNAKR